MKRKSVAGCCCSCAACYCGSDGAVSRLVGFDSSSHRSAQTSTKRNSGSSKQRWDGALQRATQTPPHNGRWRWQQQTQQQQNRGGGGSAATDSTAKKNAPMAATKRRPQRRRRQSISSNELQPQPSLAIRCSGSTTRS